METQTSDLDRSERRVLVIDDHRSFAEALAIAIDAEPGLRCVAIAATAAEGLAAVSASHPDVALVDLQLPDGSGTDLVPRLHEVQPGLPVLALTAYADAPSVAAAAEAGVCAFLRKECSVRDIVATVETAGDRPMVIDADTLAAMMRTPAIRPRPVSHHPDVVLTPREREVLRLLSEAFDAQGIAKRLGISIHTTRDYVKSLLAKLDAHTQLEAVVRAARLGILDDADEWPGASITSITSRVGSAPPQRRPSLSAV